MPLDTLSATLDLEKMILLRCSSLLILSLYFFQKSHAKHSHCSPSACGVIGNISYPFRLNHDPKKCGHREYELRCENNVTFISLNSHNYYVKAINYANSTIRLVDASLNTTDICSFPTISAYSYNFTNNYPHRPPYQTPRNISGYIHEDIPYPINFVSCPKLLENSSLFTDITANCASSPRYTYIKVGHLRASEVPQTCELDLEVMTSWDFKDLSNISLSEIHQSLLYGFELTFCPDCSELIYKYLFSFYDIFPIFVIVGLLCAAVSPPVFTIFGFAAFSLLLYIAPSFLICAIYDDCGGREPIALTVIIFGIIICATRIVIFPLAVWLLIYKFRRRHFSIFDAIESFLQSDNKLMPIRYSYSDIKKMTQSFKDKLGQGGYGSVYKGKLRSGHDVAVKLLQKSGANGQDFMNEIATIGRIHHINVVELVGYCAQGSKRALVFDFMPNGSLEKYLFNGEKVNSINWETKFDIAVGIARGIEYLHRGCDIQILHFDIKPHNILLDDKFIPKISDFGLAKFCATDKKTVTMTAARGTIGYVAPELISRSIGAVSYKADVYSFGMVLMEMVGLTRDLRGNNGGSSQYFPYWIYDCFEQGRDIEIEMADDDESGKSLVRKMTIVGLWCIQMNPDDRPSMNKVLQMLEADVARLQIPSRSTQIAVTVDETQTTCSSDSASLLHHVDTEITIED